MRSGSNANSHWRRNREDELNDIRPNRSIQFFETQPVVSRSQDLAVRQQRMSFATELRAGERFSPRRDPPPRGRLSGHLSRRALAAAEPGWQELRRAHDPEAATDYAVNPVNLSQKASHDRGPHLHHRPQIQSVHPAGNHRGRRRTHGSAAAWPRRPRLGAGHRRTPVGHHARPAPFIPAGTAPSRG